MREAKISEFMADITDSEKITRFEKAMRRTLRPTIRMADFLAQTSLFSAAFSFLRRFLLIAAAT